MSVIHPGSSINFDGANLQRCEEEDLKQEEIEQQKELHDLLSAELPDDLLEDGCDSPAQLSYNLSDRSGAWTNRSMEEGESPAQNHFYGQQRHPVSKNQAQRGPPMYNMQQYGGNFDGSFTDAEKWQMQQCNYQQQIPIRDNGVGGYGYHDRSSAAHPDDAFRFTERREAEGSEDFDAVTDGNDFGRYDDKLSVTLPYSRGSLTPGKNVHFEAFSAPTSPYNHYTAHYRQQGREVMGRMESPTKGNDSVGSEYVDASEIQRRTPDDDIVRELKQLKILYEARGKKLERMTRENEGLQEDASRDKRVLSHQLAMAKDERKGVGLSLEESQRMLSEKDRQLIEEQSKVKCLGIELDAALQAKSEMIKKVEVSERTTENLHQELVMLQRSDALDHARQQHEVVLSSMGEKHEGAMMEVMRRLDEVTKDADEKEEELKLLRSRLKSALKESEDLLLEKTETINRLSRNLEESQNHCQTLLAGNGENAFLQRQLSELTNIKLNSEEMNKTLHRELQDTKEQLNMYENALQLGVNTKGEPPAGDSYSELMGNVKKNLNFKTPQQLLLLNKSKKGDDLVTSLRHELERSLQNNKEKRDQINEQQSQIKRLKEEANHWRIRMDEIQMNQNSGHQPSSATTNLQSHDRIADLEHELQDALERAESAERRVDSLEENCRSLKQQMCEMIDQHDANKQEAVDRCERACLQLHEDAKQSIRDELLAEHEQHCYELSVEHNGQIEGLRAELDQLSGELSDVKQSYVNVCLEKDSIAESTRKELEEEFIEEKKGLIDLHAKEKDEYSAEKLLCAKNEWLNEQEKILEEKEIKRQKEINERIVQVKKDCESEAMSKLLEEKLKWEQIKESEIESRTEKMMSDYKDEERTTAATSLAQLNWITEQQNSNKVEQKKLVETAVDEARQLWLNEQRSTSEKMINEATQEFQQKIKDLETDRDNLREEIERECEIKKKEILKKKEKEMQDQLKEIHESHQKEYEFFTKQHKNMLENFLSEEKYKRMAENENSEVILRTEHEKELNIIEERNKIRCQTYENEIAKLSSSCNDLLESQNRSTEVLKLKQVEEMEKLKGKMKGEYRRWKKERANLLSQLETTKPTNMSQSALSELQQIYGNTLCSIKDEMLGFVRNNQLQTREAIKREVVRERRKIAEKLKSTKTL